MLYYDYIWDLSKDKIILDEELDASALGWREGDMFRLEEVDGRHQLIKVDPIEKFARGRD